jgi:hypothetical protein
MRTPREILLHRHRAAEPKLEAISRAALAQLNAKQMPRQPPALVSWMLCLAGTFWREAIWPARRAWAGLAAAWLLILAANLDFRLGAPLTPLHLSPGSAGLALTIREQEQLITELTEAPQPEKSQPRTSPKPQPRSQRRGALLVI